MFGHTQKDTSATNSTITGTLNVSNAAIDSAAINNLVVETSITLTGLPVYPSTGDFAVADLPLATLNIGRRLAANDSTVTAVAASYGAAVVGGGTDFVPVYSDGVVWRIG
jgi:hypothetical protein